MGTYNIADVDIETVVQKMVGREASAFFQEDQFRLVKFSLRQKYY